MSDHEFEKQVQQKMDDLKFRPSDAVWTGVEKNIRRDKRRRRALIWLPLLFLLLATGGYVVFSGKQDGEKTAVYNDHAAATKDQQDATTQPSNNNSVTKPEQSAQHQTVQTTPAEKINGLQKHNISADRNDPRSSLRIPKHIERNTRQNPTAEHKNNKHKDNGESITGIIEPKTTPAQTITAQDKTDITADVAKTDDAKTDAVIDSAKVDVAAQPEKAKQDMVIISEPASKASSNITPKKTSKWQWGITGGAGVSNVAEGGFFNILNKTKVEDLSYATTPAPSLQYNLAINPPQTHKQSPIEAGPAFSIGAFVKRNVSKKLSVSAGLQYNYFSLNTSVGELVKSSRTINVSFDMRIVNQYYGGNNLHDYVNQYHFIVLPVELQWRINKSEKIPLTLEGGVAISQLIYTNALHYDGSSGIYYKDNSLFNKTQFDLLMGLNVGLLQNSRHPLSIGPDLHYSMTRLVKKEISSGQYLWSAGLSVKILLKK